MATHKTEVILNARDQFSKVLRGMGNDLKKLKNQTQSLARDGFGKLASAGQTAITGLAIGIPLLGGVIGGLGVNAVMTAGKYENLQVALETSLGSVEKASTAFDRINDFTAKTPFQLEEVTTSFLRLKNMGLDPSERALRSYGDMASAMGKSLDQMTEAVADAATGEFERLKEFGIRASSEGDRVKFTFKGITTEVGKNSEEIEDYLIKLGETNFSGGMERQSQTLTGKLSTLRDTFDLTMASFANDTGLSDWAKKGVDVASQLLGGIKPLYDLMVKGDYSKGLNEAFGWAEDGEIVNKILDIRFAIKEIFDILRGSAPSDGGMWIDNLFGPDAVDKVYAIKEQFDRLTTTWEEFEEKGELVKGLLIGLGTAGVVALIAGLVTLVGGVVAAIYPFVLLAGAIAFLWYAWQTNMGNIQEKTQEVWGVVKPIFDFFKDMIMMSIVPSLQDLWVELQALWQLISPYIIPVLQVLGTVLGVILVVQIMAAITAWWLIINVLKWVIKGIVGLIDWIGNAINWFKKWGGTIGDTFNVIKNINLKKAGEKIIQSLIDGIKAKIQQLKNKVGEVRDSVSNIGGNIGQGVRNIIPGRAKGGEVNEPVTLVGEEGPELVSLPRGSRVHTASETRSMRQSTKSGGINIEKIEIKVGNYTGTERDKRKFADDIAEAVKKALEKLDKKPA